MVHRGITIKPEFQQARSSCRGPGFDASESVWIYRAYIFSLRTFLSLGNFHHYLLPFDQGAATVTDNCTVVDKNVPSVSLFNKSKSLFIIEPLNGSFNLL